MSLNSQYGKINSLIEDRFRIFIFPELLTLNEGGVTKIKPNGIDLGDFRSVNISASFETNGSDVVHQEISDNNHPTQRSDVRQAIENFFKVVLYQEVVEHDPN